MRAFDTAAAAEWARKAVEERVRLGGAIDALMKAINEIGDAFGRGDLWLPELMGAAAAMKAAMPILEAEMRATGQERAVVGTVVLGTVKGDIHDIGKSIVGSCLTAAGFRVHDLGVDVPAGRFIGAIEEYGPDILAMSSLLTTTALEQARIIDVLKEKGLRGRVKVMVGGGAITPEFAQSVGADGYESSGPAAARLALRLLGQIERRTSPCRSH